MCDINRNNHSHTNGWRSLGLLGVTTHVITPVPSCLSSLITIYTLYCLIKTPASLCALDVDMQGVCVCVCVCVRACVRAPLSYLHLPVHTSLWAHGGSTWPVSSVRLLKASSFDPVYDHQQQLSNLKLWSPLLLSFFLFLPHPVLIRLV